MLLSIEKKFLVILEVSVVLKLVIGDRNQMKGPTLALESLRRINFTVENFLRTFLHLNNYAYFKKLLSFNLYMVINTTKL